METITALLEPGRRTHLIGIGGVSMSALAEVLFGRGLIVTGSDRQEGEALARLRELGILVETGESGLYMPGADAAIRTAAAREDNPEVMAARRMGIPLLERADAWGELMRGYKRSLCVAGTHGKTTTTGMLAHIAVEAGADPTVMMGGRLPLFAGSYRVGQGGMIVAEACEYRNSYHRFFPTTAVILNIDADHLDVFAGLDELCDSFRTFAGLVPDESGVIVANGEDANTRRALDGIGRRAVWFGKDCAVRAARAVNNRGRYSFTVMADGKPYAAVRLKVPGRHNMLNALAAAAAAYVNGLPGKAAERGLAAFAGVGRRMECLGNLNGADIYDDYAHHPSEVSATLAAARLMGYRRLVCVFQPHTYSRTKALFEEFISALSGFDKVFLADIYAARESDPGDISSEMLADGIPGAVYAGGLDELAGTVSDSLRPGDLLITMGAGDINKLAYALLAGGREGRKA
ncbi:MAG: UDP-N-acetylmuramate--L-alanine ligase [Oscillospiraceae bacterium]|jgi:UDP-N-acetylmuramate--alanine ligase|nr:UDP-N-acetylmuramate--L-alanine ligase [Oscillospiraceae bacterium]